MRCSLLILTVAALLVGCGREASPTASSKIHKNGQADEIEKKRWQAEGWSYVETFGVTTDGAESMSFLKSDNARSITAVAFDGMQRTKKVFPQEEHLYLVVTMGKADKTYALVFRRGKAPQDGAANGSQPIRSATNEAPSAAGSGG
jgi:hypothetical protein